jgi:hypothetical protein
MTLSLVTEMYDKLVATLQYCASLSVPKHIKDVYKYWWDQELDLLKDESIKSHNLWKLARKPRIQGGKACIYIAYSLLSR